MVRDAREKKKKGDHAKKKIAINLGAKQTLENFYLNMSSSYSLLSNERE